ncbi:hypothetical protein TVAG_101500 [Trichomonas vaginalis G3]|uniref:Uncharacterized protein n=1 Tax=Trichomonas vaginalis (strain ATCC PRA-98 / G3) TaxID=412133 RepID=A2DJN2_TRIV3|nr:hypothetical protein TVAGG3_1035510 [Trichomonas vaginalis G3]EAY19432.1 hypothetical protein TVAG_101500 [Trichomonas vaginalis G3]KAI5493166.1 hypothetical protein TVAGG3_1035510 [Trichomonas vaginalis G3]|eukprot:XP_001580418.1 hypothetical protein [Trichomonas vaginalis G3]
MTEEQNTATRISAVKCLQYILENGENSLLSDEMKAKLANSIVQLLSYNPFLEGLSLLQMIINGESLKNQIVEIILEENSADTITQWIEVQGQDVIDEFHDLLLIQSNKSANSLNMLNNAIWESHFCRTSSKTLILYFEISIININNDLMFGIIFIS